jgi:PBP1b-binding outer membrane lipoprotein LpoB
MKLKHSLAFILAALILSSCVTTETTVTAPDGTVTKTKATTLSGSDIATGATGIGSAVKDVTNDK